MQMRFRRDRKVQEKITRGAQRDNSTGDRERTEVMT